MQTPYFCINTKQIDELYDDMAYELRNIWKDAIIGYSFKTNNMPWIISYMKKKGAWAETVSSDEYNLALELGFTPDSIIFNGPVKDRETFEYAVKNGSIVNVDSNREIRWLLEMDKTDLDKSRLGLRVNYCIEEQCPGESQCGANDGRFGFSYEKKALEKNIELLKANEIKFSGLHLHCSSKTRSINIYKSIAESAKKIVAEYDLDLDYIDIGGGFFGGVPGKPTFKEYFTEVKRILDTELRTQNTNVIVEPGMSLIGASVDYHTSVIDVKETKNNIFVVTDGSRTHIDPLMKKSGYTFEIAQKKENAVADNQIICGFTCMEGDRFFKYNGPKLEEGDKIIYKKVGAYTMGLSPQFIEFYPAVYVNDGTDVFKVREKVTARQFIDLNTYKGD